MSFTSLPPTLLSTGIPVEVSTACAWLPIWVASVALPHPSWPLLSIKMLWVLLAVKLWSCLSSPSIPHTQLLIQHVLINHCQGLSLPSEQSPILYRPATPSSSLPLFSCSWLPSQALQWRQLHFVLFLIRTTFFSLYDFVLPYQHPK